MGARRRLPALLAAIAVAAGLGPPGAALAAPGQEPVPPVPGLAPPVDQAGRVDSWALAPAGSAGSGNRPSLSYELQPGATVTDAVTIYNYGNLPMIFRVYGTDARNNEEGAFDVLPGDEEPRDVGSWITMGQGNVQLDPGRQITVGLTITVPVDAPAGDHVGAVLAANTAEALDTQGAAVGLDRRTGTRVYVRVAGELRPELAVESVDTTYHPSLDPLGGRATVTYRLRNRGNVRLGGRYRVSISGPFGLGGKDLPSEDLEELLPGEDVTRTVDVDDIPAVVLTRTEVRFVPDADTVGGQEVPESTRSARTFTPPLSVLVVLACLVLAARAWRVARRHRRPCDAPPGPPGPDRELQPT